MGHLPSPKVIEKSELCMGTVVTIKVISEDDEMMVEGRMDKAFKMFRDTEMACSRFDPESELMQLCKKINRPVSLSPILFETLQFSLAVAVLTNGTFDPTVGKIMEHEGFNTHYLTGQKVISDFAYDPFVTFQDVELNTDDLTAIIKKPMILDLGAVAKGFAVDLAARALWPDKNFMIDAGGDLYISGKNEKHLPWEIGIRDPLMTDQTAFELQLSQMAICTSGGYERVSPLNPDHDHIIRDWSRIESELPVSATVVAPYAMMADAFSTVLMILSPDAGISFLNEQGIDGLVIMSNGSVAATEGMNAYGYKC